MKARTTDDWAQANAEHELTVRNPVALAEARRQNPHFESVRGQALGDLDFRHAADLRAHHGNAVADTWLRERIKERDLERIVAEKVRVRRHVAQASGYGMSRLDACVHTVLKGGIPTGAFLAASYPLIDPLTWHLFMVCALLLTACRALGALLTGDVS